MDHRLINNAQTWQPALKEDEQQDLVSAIEQGRLICLPHLRFTLEVKEFDLLTPDWLSRGQHSIRYRLERDRLGSMRGNDGAKHCMRALLKAYAIQSAQLVASLFPSYCDHLSAGDTAFQINPVTEPLHIDAESKSPTQGRRILRVVSNINLHEETRLLRVGDSFESLMARYADSLSLGAPSIRRAMKAVKWTHSYRTLYDHCMLKIQRAMEKDASLQNSEDQTTYEFPAGSTWIAFTDQLPHAAVAGSFLLSQTFYLPTQNQVNPDLSPLRLLEEHLEQPLLV